jgi:phospholipid/cholesterol/gamma-HCH transport system substrate-binding protein
MRQNSSFEYISSAAVLLVASLFLFHVYQSTSGVALSDYGLMLQTDHADGLQPGSDVRINGIKVGTISSLSLKGYLADIHLRLHEGIRIPRDSSASAAADGFNPGSYLAITPGRSEQMLADGGQLAPQRRH